MTVLRKFDSLEYGPAPESRRPAEEWLDAHGRRFGHFVDGKFTDASNSECFDTRCPATGETLARIAQADASDVDSAVGAARSALEAWQTGGGGYRARCLYALARSIQRNSRLFAVLESLDNGKPIRESRDIDVPLAYRHFAYHAGIAQLIRSEFPDRSPVGVCGQIIPWNFPLLMAAWKIAPALAAGNTVVLKPAEFTPLTSMLLAELTAEAGFPPGVINIVNGDGRVGELIVDHDRVNKIAFTGSTDVGRLIRRRIAGSGKSLTLELGGKSAFIVFDDADLDSAVEGLVDAIWFNQGEVCCAGSRLLVQEGVASRFHELVKARMTRLRVGDPLDKCIDIGSLVDPVQLSRIRDMLEEGTREDGEVFQPGISLPDNGCYIQPTLITGLSSSSTLMQEEIFGPVLVSATFRTPEEAVALANNTRYGLAASVWTENINLGLDLAPKLACGVVWLNSTNLFDAAAGFGGCRESGFGREGGWEGVFEYTRPARAEPTAEDRFRSQPPSPGFGVPVSGSPIDRTAKLYVGGRQTRPDSGLSLPVRSADGTPIGQVGAGNRKDIRNAVEAARSQTGWRALSGHQRAQVIYFIAENLAARASEFERRIIEQTGVVGGEASREVEGCLDRLFTYAAWADKFDGQVHSVPGRNTVLAMKEPVGVVGVICPEVFPLLGPVSLLAPLISMGNACVLLPSESHPLSATDLYQVLDTSDLPGGVVNIVTGPHQELAATLAGHAGVDAVWNFGSPDLTEAIEFESAANLKRTWSMDGRNIDWLDADAAEGREFLHHSTEVKNVWIPYGE